MLPEQKISDQFLTGYSLLMTIYGEKSSSTTL